jgi:predicted TIM-barrel fold metal-dependent hydrolase
LLLLSDIAARNNLAIDIHFDLVPRDMDLPPMLANPNAYQPNPSRLVRNQDGLERFLAHNRQTKIVWAHVGGEPLATRTPAIVRDLLTRNPNLYMSFRIQRVRPEIPADALSPQGALKSDWVRVISDFPDRFVMGTDTFYQDSPEARGGDTVGLSNLQRLLMQLPPDVARKVAHDNVARIYRAVPAAQISAPADLPTSNPIKGAGKKAKG